MRSGVVVVAGTYTATSNVDQGRTRGFCIRDVPGSNSGWKTHLSDSHFFDFIEILQANTGTMLHETGNVLKT